ncbi:MAG TPA: peptide chain release factor 2 [Thermodesulfobacteriota bacterium]|nr:peptide chain release factor 2 [Thermodesulfobacteriota bacterium]
MLSELQEKRQLLEEKLKILEGYLDVGQKNGRLTELEKTISKPEFWSNNEEAKRVLKERKVIQSTINLFTTLKTDLEDCQVLIELASEEEDGEVEGDIQQSLTKVEKEIAQIEFQRMLDGENDINDAIVSIHAGAGGTEAQDWVSMLLRMYLRWGERKGLKTEVVDILPGDEAGIKSITFTAQGDYAYGYLRAEVGIHRLVRISPFDANSRRHTSFASVFVYPDIEDEIVIDIDESDLRVDTYRSSGKGGQHVNKTDSAVRITHLPTGIVVQCQNERSQHKNRAMAMKVLKARLYELKVKEQAQKMEDLHSGKKQIAWGSQIRSYILQPYRLVKDHRTNIEIGNVDAVLDGDIDQFIEGYLMKKE